MKRQINGPDLHRNYFEPDFANSNFVRTAPCETGVLGDTRINTPTGAKPISDLKTGHVILDAMGNEATVRHVLAAPSTRNALYMRAPYFGLDQDLVIGSDHRVMITSELAEYMFGEDTVLLPVWALKDDLKVRHVELSSSDGLFQLQLDTEQPIMIGNCPVDSLRKTEHPVGRVLTDDEARSYVIEQQYGLIR
ncbi:MAG: Hint domain-containing protein [Paracoccaceae bacterium]